MRVNQEPLNNKSFKKSDYFKRFDEWCIEVQKKHVTPPYKTVNVVEK